MRAAPPSGWHNLARAFVAAGLAGVLFALASPPHEWTALAWLVPGLLLVPARRLRPATAFACGILYAVVIGSLITSWAPPAAATYFGLGRLESHLFILAIHLLNPGLPIGLLALAYARAGDAVSPTWRPFVGAWLWVGSEMLRVWSLGWALLGHSQYQHLALIQVADLGGVYAVSFVMAWLSLSAGEAVADGAWRGRQLAHRLAAPALACAVLLAYGQWRLQQFAAEPAGGPRVAVVQGNLDNALRWNRAFFARAASEYVDLTRRSGAAGADLVVWPENAVSFYVNQDGLLRSQLGAALAAPRAMLLTGAPRRDGVVAYNSAYLLDAGGAIRGVYDKRRLVPMAEYDVLAGWRGAAADGDVYRAGAAAAPLRTPHFSIAPTICFEILYPGLVREHVRQGAEVLINLSNDSWMAGGGGAAARQHFAMGVFRAVETRRPLVRAAAAGYSGFVGPDGRILTVLPNGTATAAQATVRPRQGQTVYVRWGETWWLASGVLLPLAWRGRRRAGAPVAARPSITSWSEKGANA